MDPSSGYHGGVDPSVLERDAGCHAHQAVQYDQQTKYDLAIFYYIEASQALLSAALAGSQMPGILDKANEYMLRAETLKQSVSDPQNQPSETVIKTQLQLDLERAQFLLHQAFDEDESNNTEEAVELYMEAVELFLKIRNSASDVSLQEKATKMATQGLDRAEVLKKTPARSPGLVQNQDRRIMPPLGFNAFADNESDKGRPLTLSSGHTISRGQGPVSVGPGGYTKEEIAVLRATSYINGREYVPFMEVDLKEKFAFPVAFSDKDGKLALSPKQKKNFAKWVRPADYSDDPKMILAISPFSIRQTIVSDCSFVASLAISAQYERRFKKKLITSIIFPQNRLGEPVYNPCGKYMVKLNINGVPRKVVIDDMLPQSKYGEKLCSFSNNKNELWVSLMEKAYMKVMGGYDFPGSNSNIDLNALTGWIPERSAIRPGTEEFDKDKEFKRLLDRFHQGHCLVTVATGEISDAEADRAGLVPTHAYAMLDVREVKGKRLFMLKNPWNHLRWKGRFSENDSTSWTPDLQKALNYDPKSAQMCDNGVFWIDYDSICKFFDVFYINWNPDLFSHTTCVHHTWLAKEGPKKDSYNISDNPQYRLEIRSAQPSAVWILLTRHITDKDDFANNREFITVLVYKTGGKRVFYPYDPPPYKDGVRINSPHYLCKLVENKGTSLYTLVVSQYEKNNTIHYTLRAYSTCEFSLKQFVDPYKTQYQKKITGEWKGVTAGGCGNFPDTHKNNPIYQLKIDNSATDNCILIEVLGPKQYSVGCTVICVAETSPNAPGSFKKTTSGDFRPGYCVLQLDNISGGVYNISPCTFRPGKEGHFFLDISSSVPYTISKLQ
ncbi:calpain-7-like [Gigantopelta aegis]|uniref:calpain-7-like n=1 Tax=Gigantopelta aegis TaxID=1735272 RepID=UPI001B88B57C|nr:calpain-7-like [Gigantopelta aegis]